MDQLRELLDQFGQGLARLHAIVTRMEEREAGMPGFTDDELAEILPRIKRDIIESIPSLISRGGRFAEVYGPQISKGVMTPEEARCPEDTSLPPGSWRTRLEPPPTDAPPQDPSPGE